MIKAIVTSRQNKISGAQQINISTAIENAYIDPKGTTFAGKGNLSEKTFKTELKKIMSNYNHYSW